MSSATDIVVLAVCEDGKWGVAGRYAPGRAQRAIADAKLMMRVGGIAAARVLRHVLDPRTRTLRRELLFDDVRLDADPPPAPAYAIPSAETAPSAVEPATAQRQRAADMPRGSRVPRAPLPVPRPKYAPLPLGPASAAPSVGTRDAPRTGLSFGSLLAQLGALFSFGERQPAELPIADAAEPPGPAAQAGPAPGPAPDLRRPVSPAGRKLLEFLALALGEASRIGATADARLDAKTRFGLHLLVLGAGETCLAGPPEKGEQRLTDCIAGAMAALGSDQDAAARLVLGRDGYAADPKPAAMMRAGSEAMAAFLADEEDVGTIVADAFRGWSGVGRADGPADATGSDVAIMFTDMVSSVETTQALGDEGMMQLLAQHDLIVGAVLKTRRGHQVKHTGDGIMAVFPKVADGVAAAADIQREIERFNEAARGAPLKVRIGLSAGNPIRKEDDYFGTVVQTAARVCPLASAGEVALPEAMAMLPGCETFLYSEPVLAQLKGFAESQPVRKLLWRDAAS